MITNDTLTSDVPDNLIPSWFFDETPEKVLNPVYQPPQHFPRVRQVAHDDPSALRIQQRLSNLSQNSAQGFPSLFQFTCALLSDRMTINSVIAMGIGLAIRALADNYGMTPLAIGGAVVAGTAYLGYQYIPAARDNADDMREEFINDAAAHASLGM